VGVVRALLLGYRGELSPAAQRLAVASGTLHIFAISGMHVVVVAGIVVFALRALRIPRVHWVFPIAPVLAAYTFATGMAASAVRACVMALAYWAAPALGRRADTASALALATLGIVAAAPAQLFDVGFIYSFAAVLGLILFYRPFYAPIGRMLARDPAAEPLPRSRAAEWARAAAAHVGGVWAASCAASLTSIPLTACFFGRFSFVALPCNLFVVPLSFLMVLAACLSLALAPCAAWLAEVFNSANLAMTAALLRFLDVVTALPGACCDVPPPAPWALAVWYAALGGIAVLLQWRAARR
jgi:competence protein ComEC